MTQRAPRKDPKGGLTAAGRSWFRRTQGARLRPGVKKRLADMTPQDMKRKGRSRVPRSGHGKGARVGDDGKPTRRALSAHAWGEPVPKTARAAQRLADKGGGCSSATGGRSDERAQEEEFARRQ